VARFLAVWSLLTALLSGAAYCDARIAPASMPSAAAQRWALAALAAARSGAAAPSAPADAERYRAGGAVISAAWWQGQVRARHVGGASFADSVRKAAKQFAADEALHAIPGVDAGDDPVRFTITLVHGSARLLRGIPLLSNLDVVPLREGVFAELDGRRAYLTPDELRGDDLFDHVRTPIPDLEIGLDLDAVADRLAKQLGAPRSDLLARASLQRVRADTISAAPYPRSVPVTRAELERAAREGAEFLLRHQQSSGRYAYLYSGRTGREIEGSGYNLPRHAGTTYFLAQADRVLGMPEARAGALRALRWLMANNVARCGDQLCVRDGDRADMGSAALTALASAELLRGKDDRAVRRLLLGLNGFIRSMQRPDGELMHIYDVPGRRPIDIQRMYYSGEAADALLSSHRVLGTPEDLAAAQRVMRHLTGAAWSFFGSRYFYGEEHWTCQAVAQEAAITGDSAGLDFCIRWLGFQRALQYKAGDTPWPVAGAIGVGPLIVPRLTTVASRVEAAAMLYPVLRARGGDVAAIRAQIENSLGLLLRMRWAPGPTHLLMDPRSAFGALPASIMSLEVRNDYVQHACSAMLLWAEVLRGEKH
jgi:hypothetical protein